MSKLCHCAQEEGEGTPPDYEASPDACPGGADEEFPVQAQPCGNARCSSRDDGLRSSVCASRSVLPWREAFACSIDESPSWRQRGV